MMTVNEFADRLHISRSKAYVIVDSGKVASHKFDGAIRITEEQLTNYLAATLRPAKEKTPQPKRPGRPHPIIDELMNRRR
jgi:excisionase family DNA binding protein